MVDVARLLGDLRSLARIGCQQSGGITRRAFSPEYQDAVRWLLERMREARLAPWVDAAGNVFGRLGPRDAKAVIAGSHIDTVPDGGWLDGAYGVLAALECARALQEADIQLRHALEVAAFADEEGSYLSLLGSRAVVGALGEAEVSAARDGRGMPLEQAMRQCGLDPARLHEARRDPAGFHAYLELHIEQGPVLEQRGVRIGVVEGIAGILLNQYRFTGSADHAGTTPIELRRDALRCAAQFITTIYERVVQSGHDVRVTFGALDVLPGATNVVPRSARLMQEIRSLDTRLIEEWSAVSQHIAANIGTRLGIDVDVVRVTYDEPVSLSEPVIHEVEGGCDEAGIPWLRMTSGAGHDAQSFAHCCPTGMIFVPSRRGASHRPDEETAEADLGLGAEVLMRTVRRLAA